MHPIEGVAAFIPSNLERELTLTPAQTQADEINHHDGGRGFYFEDPNGHFLEVITRPYGSGGYPP